MATKKTKKTVSKTSVSKAKTVKATTTKNAKKTTKQSSKKVVKKPAVKAAKKVSKKATKVAKKVIKKTPKKTSVKTTKKVVKKVASKRKSNTLNNDSLIHGIEPYKEKAREKYMSAKQMTHFKSILLAWKTNLLDEVSKTIHLMQDENINHPDPNDRASQETDMSLELRNRDRERKLLKKIEKTMTKVDGGDYGWCDRCGIEIGIRRLEARPTADLCVDCKTLNEIKERQMI